MYLNTRCPRKITTSSLTKSKNVRDQSMTFDGKEPMGGERKTLATTITKKSLGKTIRESKIRKMFRL